MLARDAESHGGSSHARNALRAFLTVFNSCVSHCFVSVHIKKHASSLSPFRCWGSRYSSAIAAWQRNAHRKLNGSQKRSRQAGGAIYGASTLAIIYGRCG